MLDTIKSILNQLNISVWQLTETRVESAELYFIRKREDMRRAKNVQEISVTVYRDFTLDDQPMRGASSIQLQPGMTNAEIEKKLLSAYDSAQYVKNPFFELADPVCENAEATDALTLTPAEETAAVMAEALFTPDRFQDAFINSAEIFVIKKHVRTLSSRGSDVTYTVSHVKGEFVAQCVEPSDVEMYFDFDVSEPDTLALSGLSADAIRTVSDRAKAAQAPAAGEYNLILTEKHLFTLFSSYLYKADASMIYTKYSPWSIGANVQGEAIAGEKLNITAISTVPFSQDGIKMLPRTLLRDGVLQAITGDTRYMRYLNLTPTGSYDAIRLNNGSVSLEDMKKRPYLMPVSFSDFQMDPMSGYFGGEIRLAYLFDGERVSVVTGGSVSGSLIEKQRELTFSKETWKSSDYEGPRAVLIPGVSVAGA